MSRRKTLSEFERALRRAQLSITKESKAAVGEASERMKVEATRLVPVDKGLLRDSLATWKPKSKRGRIKGGVKAPIGHAHLQEFGTVNHPPRPFLRPAGDKVRPGLREGLKEAIKTGLAKVDIGDR